MKSNENKEKAREIAYHLRSAFSAVNWIPGRKLNLVWLQIVFFTPFQVTKRSNKLRGNPLLRWPTSFILDNSYGFYIISLDDLTISSIVRKTLNSFLYSFIGHFTQLLLWSIINRVSTVNVNKMCSSTFFMLIVNPIEY